VLLETGDELATRRGHCCIPCQHHKIDCGEAGSAQPETLPHQPAKPVAPDSQADFLFGNSEAQTWPTQGVLVEKYREKAICRPLAILEHVIKARRVQEAQLPREGLLVFARRKSGQRGDRDLP
jgi:hypothetical protein